VHAIAGGEVDIVMGPTGLLSSDVTFKDLGLLIVDEEHRFRRAATGRLKALKLSVDVLTLTAPRFPNPAPLAAGLPDLALLETARRPSPGPHVREPWTYALLEERWRASSIRGGQGYSSQPHRDDRDVAARVRGSPRARLAVRTGRCVETISSRHGPVVRGEVEYPRVTMIV